MSRYFRYVYVLPVVVVLSIAILIFVFLFMREEYPYVQNGLVDFQKARVYFFDRIETAGAQAASADYITSGKRLTSPEAHRMAHAFGEALYVTEGVDGVRYCTDQFMYGCYHQLIGQAILEHGIAVTDSLLRICEESDTAAEGCEHGLGHGIMSYFGYTVDSLKKSVDLCLFIDRVSIDSACVNGVFMEYNLRNMVSSETALGVTPRPLADDTRYAPCKELDGLYGQECIIQLPLWWLYALPASMGTTERFTVAGSYCKSLPLALERQRCFVGIGRASSFAATLDASTMRRHCEAASSDDEDRLMCFVGIGKRFQFIQGSGRQTCNAFGLDVSGVRRCMDLVDKSLL
ncbi:MAG TPA: hypothetical protein VJJ20_03770 [Candidatus Paceibacterota bacterium]